MQSIALQLWGDASLWYKLAQANGLAPGAVAVGGAAAALGSIVSQGVGVATGLQDRFDWGGVGLAALSGGIGGGLGQVVKGGGFLAGAARGAIGGAATQGLAVATGLQAKFDFAGVAGAALGGGIGSELKGAWSKGGLSFGESLVANTAGGIANAAARSLIEGTSFGDNIVRALPDVIASTVGDRIAGAVTRRGRSGASPSRAPGLPRDPNGNRLRYLIAPDDEQWVTGTMAPGQPDEGKTVRARLVSEHGSGRHLDVNRDKQFFYHDPSLDAALAADATPPTSSGWGIDWLSNQVTALFSGLPSFDAGAQARLAGASDLDRAVASHEGVNNYMSNGVSLFTTGLWETLFGFTTTAAAPPAVLLTERASSPFVTGGGRAGLTSSPWISIATDAFVASRFAPVVGKSFGAAEGVAANAMRYSGRRMDVRAKFVDSPAAQATTPGHSFASRREAYRLALDPEVERVTMNAGYNRLLRLEPGTISPNVRPDVGAVYFDGRVARTEVMSAGDRAQDLIDRNIAVNVQLRNNNFSPLPPRVISPRVR